MERSRMQGDTAAKPITFVLYSSTDHTTPIAALAPVITISKNGAAYAAADGPAVSIGSGLYKYTPDEFDLDTLGELSFKAVISGADIYFGCVDVVPWDQFAFDPVTTGADIARILGLVQQNRVFEPTYDGNGDCTGGTVYIYDTAAHATTNDHATGLLYRYTLTNTLVSRRVTVAKALKAL